MGSACSITENLILEATTRCKNLQMIIFAEGGGIRCASLPQWESNMCSNKPELRAFSDCSLRQGAGGTEFAHLGSRTCFLRWFYKRYQTYFGQKSEDHIKTIKKTNMDVKNDDFWKQTCLNKNIRFSFSFPSLQGPGPGPYGPEKKLKNA
mgnify:CR=1 FL=1